MEKLPPKLDQVEIEELGVDGMPLTVGTDSREMQRSSNVWAVALWVFDALLVALCIICYIAVVQTNDFYASQPAIGSADSAEGSQRPWFVSASGLLGPVVTATVLVIAATLVTQIRRSDEILRGARISATQ